MIPDLLPAPHRHGPKESASDAAAWCRRVGNRMARARWRGVGFLLLLLSLLPPTGHAAEDLAALRPLLRTYCFECHGAEKQKGDLRLDLLPTDLSDDQNLIHWQDVLDQLNLGEMPPPKAAAHPTDAEVATLTQSLTEALTTAYADRKSTGRQTVLRRLNRLELRNTLRDLLYLDGADLRTGNVAKLVDNNGNGITSRDSQDPIRDFPPDEEEAGFDTIGDRLVMSDFLLQLVIGAAEEFLALATHPEPRPALETRRFTAPLRTDGPNACLESWARELKPGYDVILQRYREPGASTGGLGRVSANELARQGVGVAGRYRITIEASAHNQQHPWGELITSRQDEPILLGLHLADTRYGGFNEANPTSRQVQQWEMPDDGTNHLYSYETYLDATWTPWIGWENAPYDRALRPSLLVEKYLPHAYQPPPGNDAEQAAKEAYEPAMARALFTAGYQGPQLRIHSLTVEPLLDTWPPASHTFLYGSDPAEPFDALVLRFAQRAFRRPVQPGEVQRYVDLAASQLAGGASRIDALQVAYTALLASPRFFYLPEAEAGLPLDDYELASRLSYFLWSSMPDDTLFALAAAGRLRDPRVLEEQVERLLAHRNAEAFTYRFTERWLRLDKLGAMPPEMGGPFRFYWDRQMEPEIVKQTVAYFADLVRNNGPIRDLIDSDYTFLNERVASLLYGRDDVWGDAFRKVKVLDPVRGGILTHPSVLTATANGVDTSPIVRGVWVLENILGTPPAAPPPNVQPLAPDLRGAATIREQLERHREDETCNSCHRKIDPMGFALENFDPIGRWRDTYPENKLKIDPSAELPGGRSIADIVALRKYLLTREDDVIRCLTGKLLTYASGRLLEPGDRGEVDRLVAAVRAKGGGLRDLLKLVTQSEIFLTK